MTALCAVGSLATTERMIYRQAFGRVASMDPLRAGDEMCAKAVALVYEPLLVRAALSA